MSQKIALLFAGQGAQVVGMGKDLAAEFPAAANLFKRADEILGFPLSQTAFEGPADELDKDRDLSAGALCAWSGVSRRS